MPWKLPPSPNRVSETFQRLGWSLTLRSHKYCYFEMVYISKTARALRNASAAADTRVVLPHPA
jgi:hypothetical protein